MAIIAIISLKAGVAAAESWDFVTIQRWLIAAERAAHDDVTESLCSGNPVDSRLAGVEKAIAHGATPDMLARIVGRYDDTLRERRRLEAVLAQNSANTPERRFGGLFATDGCRTETPRSNWILPP